MVVRKGKGKTLSYKFVNLGGNFILRERKQIISGGR